MKQIDDAKSSLYNQRWTKKDGRSPTLLVSVGIIRYRYPRPVGDTTFQRKSIKKNGSIRWQMINAIKPMIAIKISKRKNIVAQKKIVPWRSGGQRRMLLIHGGRPKLVIMNLFKFETLTLNTMSMCDFLHCLMKTCP